MNVVINKIIVGERLRQDLGDIDGLAQSIKEHGLLHPIVIDSNYNLVVGGRRLEASKKIGKMEIEVKMLGELTERELRVLELEENIQRKNLTEIEKSRNLVELTEAMTEVMKSEIVEVLPETGKTNVGGRPSNTGVPLSDVADRIGIPRQTIQAAQQHKKAVDKYPALVDFPKHKAINTACQLDKETNEEKKQETLQEIVKENNKKIDEEYRISSRVKKLIDSGFGESITEDELDLYLQHYPKSIDEHLERINATINTFQKIKTQLESRKKIRRLK